MIPKVVTRTMQESPTDLLKKLPFLTEDLGFTVVADQVSSSFGNMYVVLTNGTVDVCVARDRGFVDIEVRPAAAPERWLSLSHLRQVVLQLELSADITIDQQAEFLGSHFAEIVELISPQNWENTNERVMELGRARLRRLYPGSIRE